MFAKPANGLFNKAILQSNAGFGLPEETPGNGHVRSSMQNEQDRGSKLGKIIGSENKPLSLEELRALPAQKILDVYQKTFPNYYHSPAVDGYLIEKPTWLDIQNSNLSSMKVIVGTNADEYYANTPENTDYEMLESISKQLFDSSSHIAMNVLQNEEDPRNALDRLYTAEGMLCPSEYLASKITKDSGYSWVYYFSRIREGESAQHPMIRAYHGAELPYVFNTHDEWMTTSDLDLEITEIITDYWTNFAKTGNPNGYNAPNWPIFDENQKIRTKIWK